MKSDDEINQNTIMQNLYIIDSINSSEKLSEKDKSILFKTVIQTLEWVDENLNKVENNIPSQLLEFIYNSKEVI